MGGQGHRLHRVSRYLPELGALAPVPGNLEDAMLTLVQLPRFRIQLQLQRRSPRFWAAVLTAWLCACETHETEPPSSAGASPSQTGLALDGGSVDAPIVTADSAPTGSASPADSGAIKTTIASEAAAPNPSGDAGTAGCATFSNSFEAIQKLIFERRGCTASTCHGDAKVGGLDLRAEVSWTNLVDAKSSNSNMARVQPGAASESYLYQKLRAATEPGSVMISGSPMPVGTAPLSQNELEAIQLWIVQGASQTGVAANLAKGTDVGMLLNACLPPTKPVKIKPLEPPAPDEGIQLRLPPYLLKAASEVETCTLFSYDFTEKVPDQHKDVARNVMYINGSRVRQDPQSHHMVVWDPSKDVTSVAANDPAWTCRGGASDSKPCNAQKGSADCGDEGVCAGPTINGTFCDGEVQGANDDPLDGLLGLIGLIFGGGMPKQIAITQSPQQYTAPLPGVYSEIPLRGIMGFNSHAFNLTETDTLLEARVNYYYPKERVREMRGETHAAEIGIAAGQPPFTRKSYCTKAVVSRNYSLAMLTGHTHRRGEHFWVKDASGKQIYESFNYNDPEYTRYDPWLEFPSADEASRTLEYCATFNNGLKKDGSPDLELVTRASRMPERTMCTPIACVAGKVTAACATDPECDTAPGKGDGDCDACAITQGPTTEDEMFLLMPWYVLPARP
jgi:hypothetical protein